MTINFVTLVELLGGNIKPVTKLIKGKREIQLDIKWKLQQAGTIASTLTSREKLLPLTMYKILFMSKGSYESLENQSTVQPRQFNCFPKLFGSFYLFLTIILHIYIIFF